MTRSRYTKRKATKRRAKSVTLDKTKWLRNSKEIAAYRAKTLEAQDGCCAVSGLPLDEGEGCLDHSHAGASRAGTGSDGRVRGVLDSQTNLLEGRFLSLWRKSRLDVKSGLTLPQFLHKLATYLEEDNSEAPLHFKYMDDYRKQVSRWRKDTIINKIKSEFNVDNEADLEDNLHTDLVQIYMQLWIDNIERGKYVGI